MLSSIFLKDIRVDKRQTNKIVNTIVDIKSNNPMEESSPPVDPGPITAWGCKVLHHFIEKYTIGTSRKPIIPKIAAYFAPCSGEGEYALSVMYAQYMSQSIKEVVRRGSQFHQTPQTGFAHITPVTIRTVVKSTPTSALAKASLSQALSLLIKYPMLPIKTKKKAKKAVFLDEVGILNNNDFKRALLIKYLFNWFIDPLG